MKFVLIFALMAALLVAALGSPFTSWDSSPESESDNVSSNATHSSNEIRKLMCENNHDGQVGKGGRPIDCKRYQGV